MLIFELRDYFVGEIVFVSNIYWSNVDLGKSIHYALEEFFCQFFMTK